MFDRDAFHDALTEETAKSASSTDAVNGAVGFYTFVAAELRKHANNPVAVQAIADAIDKRKTDIAQAAVLNTGFDPDEQAEHRGWASDEVADWMQEHGYHVLTGDGGLDAMLSSLEEQAGDSALERATKPSDDSIKADPLLGRAHVDPRGLVESGPHPITQGGTEALPGDGGTVKQPTADTPSYAPSAPGVTATTDKTDTDKAAEEQMAAQNAEHERRILD